MGGPVRCVECETDPLTPGHFCECCGRKLSLQERAAREATPALAAPVVEASRPTASAGPCESCGGPSSDRPLCESCQSAFRFVIDPSPSAPVTPEIAPGVEESAPVTAVANLVPTLTGSEVAGVEAVEGPTHAPDSVEPTPAHADAGRPTATVAPVTESSKAEFAHGLAAVVTARSDVAPSPETEFARAVSAQQSRAQWMGLAAAAVIAVAVMGVPLGVWLGTRNQGQPEPRQTAAPRAQTAALLPASGSAATVPAKHGDVLAAKA